MRVRTNCQINRLLIDDVTSFNRFRIVSFSPRDVSSLRHSSEGGSGASKHAHFDPYPKSVTSLVAQPLQVCSIFEFDMNVRHVTYMHDEVWAVLTNGSVLVLDPEQGKVKRKVKVRERERRESWWSRWLSE